MSKFSLSIPGVLFSLLMSSQVQAAVSEVFCYERENVSQTRVLMTLNEKGRLASLYVVTSELAEKTPEILWSAPGQEETRRFPADKSDVSPDLMEKMRSGEATVVARRDGNRELMQVRFAASAPDSLDVEGFRGSVAILDSFVNGRAPAALYYGATGNIEFVIGLQCQQVQK